MAESSKVSETSLVTEAEESSNNKNVYNTSAASAGLRNGVNSQSKNNAAFSGQRYSDEPKGLITRDV